MPADTVDHVPPISVRGFLFERGFAKRYPFLEVRSCHECNCILGARALWTPERRKEFIKKALRKRYKKYLTIPEWTDADIGRLGPGLQVMVLHGLAMLALTKERLKW